MAFPASTNGQTTDSVTQVNVQTAGTAPAVAMANLYQATAQALAIAAHNASIAQQQLFITSQAATAKGVALLYSLNTSAASKLAPIQSDTK